MDEKELLLKEIKEQNIKQLDEFKKELKTLADDSRKGLITQTDFDEKYATVMDNFKEFDLEKYKAFETTLGTLKEQLGTQGTELQKMKDGGLPSGGAVPTLRSELKEIMESDDYKAFVDSNGAKSAKFKLKAVSMTSDYTGTVFVTTRDPRVVDHPQVVRLNIRDLLTVMPTDLPYLAFSEVVSWDREADVIAENGELADTTFDVQEATVSVKRIGTAVPISKRMLKSVTFVMNHLENRLPAQVKYVEDFQLLFGDNAGNNLQGLFENSDDFVTRINTVTTGAAASVSSIATYDSGTKVKINLAANYAIGNGDNITIANATEATYNDTFPVIVQDPQTIYIEVAYVAEADTSAWTFTVASAWKASVEAAQAIDVLTVAKSLINVNEYACNGFVLNPQDAAKIEMLKGSDEHYLGVVRGTDGVLRISGTPVVETTAMPAGRFIAGDWLLGAALLEFTELNLEFSEDTTDKKKNQVTAIIQEEILFPIYNKYMFVSGSFSTAITAITVT